MKTFFKFLLLWFFMSSQAFPKEGKPLPKVSHVKLQTSISLIPMGLLKTQTGFEGSTFNKIDDSTGLGLAAYLALIHRPHRFFGYGLSVHGGLFFEKTEFSNQLNQPATSTKGAAALLPLFVDIMVPLKTYIPLGKYLELQPTFEGGVQLLGLPGSSNIGFSPVICPSLELEINPHESGKKGVSWNLAVGYSMSWPKIIEKQKLIQSTPNFEAQVNYVGFLQTRIGLSFNF